MVNAVILVLCLVLCLYMAVQFSRNSSSAVSTQRTQTVTDSSYAYLEGYIFRDERALVADAGTVVNYLVGDGEKVGVGQHFASVYSSTGLGSAERAQKEEQLLSLAERIALMESGLKQNSTSSDLSAISKKIAEYYYSYSNATANGDVAAAEKAGELLLSAMVEYSVGTGGETAKNMLSELKKQQKELWDSLGDATELVSESGFNFAYSSDGYENIFSSDKVDTLTPDGLLELAGSAPEESIGRVIGRMIYTPKWYIAIPANEATYLAFSEGSVYDVTFSDSNGVTVDMTLERICVDEQDENSAYLLFSSYDLSIAASFSRTQSVRIYMGSVSGYRVPKQAVYKGEQYDYVYVLVGNMVEMRRVSVKGEGNGYYVVSTYEEDLRDNVWSEIPYLNINDLLITSGNDLYDGKLLD
ncbi:MAG: hypothetical protein IJC64_03805 [Clostridia bacterium]|nr:hypothetical protein [Clostridia bacterium]